LNIYQGLDVTISELLEAVLLVQSLDPAGVCARSVNECLRLQAERRMSGDFSKDFICRTAVAILDEFFDDFTAKRYDRILRRVEVERTKEGVYERITKEELDAAIEFIQGLNPHPCHIYTDAKYLRGYDSITPDFYYDSQSDHLTVSSGRIPALSVSREYTKMLEQVEKLKKEGHKDREGSEVFLRDRIESAQQFIDAIAQRNATLSKVMTAIIKVQRAFFQGGCDDSLLQPLTMKQVAEMADCDISTVSRVANSKFIDVDHQYTFRLKHFFSEGITTQSGETVSNKMIMETIKSLVEAEDKSSPLTDDAIAAILNEKGYNVARRTVAKYRGTLGIPNTRERING
ncbi:MAG: RNA polymerase sigma-54 factor, partial [Paludibacteraceae bacterium]|nr:RNA polymerase sigma-54 factor [Paludibacteraceae bacterium]